MGKIVYLRSKRDGFTFGGPSYGSQILDAGELVPASQVNPAVVTLLEEGDPHTSENAELIELDPKEAAKLMAGPDAEEAEGEPDQIELTPVVAIDDPNVDVYDPVEHTVDEVLAYLKSLDDSDEFERVKTAELASDRASTQVAALEYKAA